MSLTLSWDLLIIVFFAIVIAYSFIIGKHEAMKIIISSYIAILTVQGLGNIFARLSGESEPLVSALGIAHTSSYLSTVKIGIFVASVIFLAIRGGFSIAYERDVGGGVGALLTALFGFATAGLMLSTILTYVTGADILSHDLPSVSILSPLLQGSTLAHALVLNQDLWFSFPALLLCACAFLGQKKGE